MYFCLTDEKSGVGLSLSICDGKYYAHGELLELLRIVLKKRFWLKRLHDLMLQD